MFSCYALEAMVKVVLKLSLPNIGEDNSNNVKENNNSNDPTTSQGEKYIYPKCQVKQVRLMTVNHRTQVRLITP